MKRKQRGIARCVAGGLLLAALYAGTAAGQGQSDAEREKWQKVEQIFEAMQVKPGAVVADVGAGGGFFTSRLSRAVGPQGRVIAVDIAADALRRLRARIADEGLSNVQVMEASADDPHLPESSLDAALIVNAYHEMDQHQAVLSKIRAALKPSGRLVIVEPIAPSRRDAARDDQTRNHQISMQFVLEDARAAGFTQLAAQDPFTDRAGGRDIEWILVLAPTAPAAPARQAFSAANEDWKAPELRITVEEFKRLNASGGVLIVDVRDPQSYRQGHLPGAVLITPEELSTPEGIAKLRGEKRQIVAYCS